MSFFFLHNNAQQVHILQLKIIIQKRFQLYKLFQIIYFNPEMKIAKRF